MTPGGNLVWCMEVFGNIALAMFCKDNVLLKHFLYLTYVLLTINLSEMLTRAGENTLCVNETAALTFAPKINKHM